MEDKDKGNIKPPIETPDRDIRGQTFGRDINLVPACPGWVMAGKNIKNRRKLTLYIQVIPV